MGWEVIIPFLKPIEPFLLDPSVSDILVNGSSRVFVEREGQLEEIAGITLTEKALQVAVRNIARVLGDDISPAQPLLDSRLPDGSRVAAVLAPCAVSGTVLAIRKFHGQRLSADELLRLGTLTPGMLSVLRKSVESGQNILISGGTGTGKTTLLNALAAFIHEDERVVVIEDTSEIQLALRNLVRLEARREQPGLAAVTIRDLLKTTLRLRPDRIILGEVRDGAAFDLLQALNTGHSGTLATIHANSAAQAIARFTTCVLMSGIELPYKAIRINIAEALNLLVHIERRNGKRVITEVLNIVGYDPTLDQYKLATAIGNGT
jgi:pilus assembly protein CpaF